MLAGEDVSVYVSVTVWVSKNGRLEVVSVHVVVTSILLVSGRAPSCNSSDSRLVGFIDGKCGPGCCVVAGVYGGAVEESSADDSVELAASELVSTKLGVVELVSDVELLVYICLLMCFGK